MIELVEETTDCKGRHMDVLADAGFATNESYEGLEKKPNIDAYVPPMDNHKQSHKPQSPYDKYSFSFDIENRKCVDCGVINPLF